LVVGPLARFALECQAQTMNQNQYAEMRNEVKLESVSFGMTTVTLFKTDKLEQAQIGFSVHPNGETLSGSSEGDWQKSWLVIGEEDLCGDPIFTDLDSEKLPIYTAMHGEGSWEPVLLAESFSNFIQILEQFHSVAKGREHTVALQNNPLPESEANAITNYIKQNNPNAELNFWETWLAGFNE
jgi:hypothetical protein